MEAVNQYRVIRGMLRYQSPISFEAILIFSAQPLGFTIPTTDKSCRVLEIVEIHSVSESETGYGLDLYIYTVRL